MVTQPSLSDRKASTSDETEAREIVIEIAVVEAADSVDEIVARAAMIAVRETTVAPERIALRAKIDRPANRLRKAVPTAKLPRATT